MIKNRFLRKGVFALVLVFAALTAYSEVQDYLSRSQYMGTVDASKRWGHKSFNMELFRTGTSSDRALMAVDIIDKKLFIGKTAAAVKSELGRPTGYFWSDHFPAYFIEEGWSKKRKVGSSCSCLMAMTKLRKFEFIRTVVIKIISGDDTAFTQRLP